MNTTATEWTLDGFVEHFGFVHHKMLDHKLAWVLGAGASHASGIPLGSKLVDQWLGEMHVREGEARMALETWATAERLGIVGFKYDQRASFYSKIYQRRFQKYPEEGYAYLEDVMSGRDPSPGYSILASALAADPPRHNVVVTTNFDNLMADALSIYTDTFPFVCGHESLTTFVRVAMRRPLICKIHRDLLLGPQNDPRSLRRLHDAWGTALRALFQHYTPLFIGYGGNDDTLMDLLESLQPGDIKGQMIWCYYEEERPSERIVNAVMDLKGVLVPVPDFDLLMVLLGEKMGISLLDEEIDRRAGERTQRYRERIQHLDTVRHPSVTKALAATLDRSGGWWAWEQKARLEEDPERRETVYRQAIQHCPNSCPLCATFANFLTDVRGKHDEAERLYRKAIDLDPKHAGNIGNFACFLADVRGKYDEAERLYRKAIDLDPKHAGHIGNFAGFQWQVRHKHKEAERLYRKALRLDSRIAAHTCNYAGLLLTRKRLDEATEKLERARLLNGGKEDQVAAEATLYAAILARVRQQDDTTEINRLKVLLSKGFDRSPWSFDDLLSFARKNVPAKDYTLYSGVAAAILDPKKVPDVDRLLQQRLAADRLRRNRSTTARHARRKLGKTGKTRKFKPKEVRRRHQ